MLFELCVTNCTVSYKFCITIIMKLYCIVDVIKSNKYLVIYFKLDNEIFFPFEENSRWILSEKRNRIESEVVSRRMTGCGFDENPTKSRRYPRKI